MRLQRDKSLLLMVDFQAGLLPAIDGGEAAISEAHWLFGVADALAVPVWLTEQMPETWGHGTSVTGSPTSAHDMAKAALRDYGGSRVS